MLTMLFWNLNNRDCSGRCANLAGLHNASLLVVAECRDPIRLLNALNRTEVRYFPHPTEARVALYSRFPPDQFVQLDAGRRHAVHALTPPGAPELLIVTVHASSALYRPDGDRDAEFRRLANTVRTLEARRKHQRTLVIGDFNAQPFDGRMTAADHLHAVFSRSVADKRSRTVAGEQFPFFYNPSWKFFANRSPDPQGTFFYQKAELNNLFWHSLDQLLIRPSLLPYFHDDDLRILTTDGQRSLLDQAGRPDRDAASDHLPIMARFNYPGV